MYKVNYFFRTYQIDVLTDDLEDALKRAIKWSRFDIKDIVNIRGEDDVTLYLVQNGKVFKFYDGGDEIFNDIKQLIWSIISLVGILGLFILIIIFIGK